MAKKAFAWMKTYLCCCWCKKKQKNDLYFDCHTFECEFCAYKSSTKKGLRWHKITAHKIDVQTERTVDAYGRPLDFFAEIPEETHMKQNYQGEIYDGDDDFEEQMKWALSDSISMAAARNYFDSDTDDDDEGEIKHITADMIQKMMMKPLKIQ